MQLFTLAVLFVCLPITIFFYVRMCKFRNRLAQMRDYAIRDTKQVRGSGLEAATERYADMADISTRWNDVISPALFGVHVNALDKERRKESISMLYKIAKNAQDKEGIVLSDRDLDIIKFLEATMFIRASGTCLFGETRYKITSVGKEYMEYMAKNHSLDFVLAVRN